MNIFDFTISSTSSKFKIIITASTESRARQIIADYCDKLPHLDYSSLVFNERRVVGLPGIVYIHEVFECQKS